MPGGVRWFPRREAAGWDRRAARARGRVPSVPCWGLVPGRSPSPSDHRSQAPFGDEGEAARLCCCSFREKRLLSAGPDPPAGNRGAPRPSAPGSRSARHFPSLSGVPAGRFGCFRNSSALSREFPCWGLSRLSGVTQSIWERVRPSAPGPRSGAAGG